MKHRKHRALWHPLTAVLIGLPVLGISWKEFREWAKTREQRAALHSALSEDLAALKSVSSPSEERKLFARIWDHTFRTGNRLGCTPLDSSGARIVANYPYKGVAIIKIEADDFRLTHHVIDPKNIWDLVHDY